MNRHVFSSRRQELPWRLLVIIHWRIQDFVSPHPSSPKPAHVNYDNKLLLLSIEKGVTWVFLALTVMQFACADRTHISTNLVPLYIKKIWKILKKIIWEILSILRTYEFTRAVDKKHYSQGWPYK